MLCLAVSLIKKMDKADGEFIMVEITHYSHNSYSTIRMAINFSQAILYYY